MLHTDIAYEPVEGGGKKSDGVDIGGKEEQKEKEGKTNKRHRRRLLGKGLATTEGVIREEEESKDDDADSNNNESSSSPQRGSFIRRTMSFLVTLPRKLFSYVREVFYSPQQRWAKVGQEDSEESDWSSSEDGTTGRANKHRRSSKKSRDRHEAKRNRAPPPVAPKPKRKDPTPNSSSNPPSSPDTTTPNTSPEISFDDIAVESPQLKIYKRIHGPQGRRRPQRYSNQSDVRQSESQFENDSS